MRGRKVSKNVNISNGLFFFKKCLINATVCANFLTRSRAEFNCWQNFMRLHFSKKNNPLLKCLPFVFSV